MDSSIGKLLPIDGFKVLKRGVTPKYEQWALTHLYQPVIGVLAVSLYQFLISEWETNKQEHLQTHHVIMSYLACPLDKIYEARKKLESIGLLKSYVNDHEDTVYLYELRPPLAAEEFFNDTFLSLLLQHQIGMDKFNLLQSRFDTSWPEVYAGFEEITVSFEHMFNPQVKGYVKPNHKEATVQKGPVITDSSIDFKWLEAALKKRMYPAGKILNGVNKKVIVQLAALYNLSSTEIERALTWAVNDEYELDLEEFKSACHDFMKNESKDNEYVLNEREKVNKTQGDPGSKEDQFVDLLEQISPRELLEDLSNGNQASNQDMRIVRDVMTEQGLSPGVMNVLVHYVLLKTDMKLSKAYLEKIASHWARKNVTTVRQAMNLAKAEHQQYQQWGGQSKRKYQNKKPEVIPEWFKKQDAERERQEQEHSTPAAYDTTDLEERIRKLSKKGHGS
ncbi:replication initiation and membrane attachment family protein [Halobacillus sp. A5]|uniref:replication initiation and membrane attachment family protein n=1 Tax=Halobacillus sp. A5 TaxID=2880263 RepID=UPI0020A6C3B5|nr:DnaD domain protein [Halobacillus sp. A5]MCP3025474.1 DnaD domain protein [Halobacillus sp. A5]